MNENVPNQNAAPKGVEILVVEDSLTQAMKLQYFLEQHGYQVTVARDGSKGLSRVQSHKPTLVITDVEMPEMNGYELCRHIKTDAALRDLPVILLTSLSDPKDVVHGLECGADHFVVKPYDEQFLLSRIDHILAGLSAPAPSRPQGGGVEVFFAGEKHVLSTAPSLQTTVDLLLGTYETAILKNQELSRAREMLEEQAAELRTKNEHMQADLNLAREIQNAFLPDEYPSFPPGAPLRDSALRFCRRYIPATTLGGDFFDVLALSDTQAGVFICDVMGHGVRSALITAMMRALVGERTGLASDPGLFLQEINRHLLGILQQTRTPLFASAFYVVVDVERREMHYSNAGHPSPLWARRAKGTVETLPNAEQMSGPALGVFEDAAYPTSRCSFESGDLVVLFTDGLYEVEGSEEEYGEERLMNAVQRRLNLPSDALFDEVLAEVQAFAANGQFEDDVCLLSVEATR